MSHEENKIKISGRSGCLLEFKEVDSRIIRKYSKSKEYNQRLMKQMKKQIYYSRNLAFDEFSFAVPSVKDFYDGLGTSELAFFEMEYINATKFSDYFLELTIGQLEELISKLQNYFENLKKGSIVKYIDKQVFIDKLEELYSKLMSSEVVYEDSTFSIIEELKRKIPREPLPIGFCHGDFTCSNMLFKGDVIFIYDFLDSFIESYIIDIVKLRQDTAIYWSLLIDDKIDTCHKTKLKIVLNHIDESINAHFSKDQYYRYWYSYLQKINLLRILPYLESLVEVKYVENQLKKII